MPETTLQDHYASAALRHHDDAVYLHEDGRLPNADHHYGFVAECAVKSLLIRNNLVSVEPHNRPWLPKQNGKPRFLGHFPSLQTDTEPMLAAAALQMHGRGGTILSGVISAWQPFADWSPEDRYLDGASVDPAQVSDRRAAAEQILSLHEQALIVGVLT
ncbi:hypothetical protein [Streptomyces sp. NPDC058674]|uniref:hypothetical protein n=1 Tax=Streptomyces sp. NPDC058674 TaxID=3346592 RepID=UPI00364F21D4